ncbi:LexA family transcriptional regulator [Puteibacter caeruleilacunae]|nr:LexA family transcriptional regulator [Puteibacter caeruleilacunae]
MLPKNLRYLRLSKRLTQQKMGARLRINPSSIGSYENGRSLPRVNTLQRLSDFFNRPIDDMLKEDIENNERVMNEEAKGDKLRVLPIVVDQDNQEQVSLVPIKAAAGYTQGYSDAEFIGELPRFNLPFMELSPERTYRVFQIEGDSMLPIPPKSYVICEYIQDWNAVQDNEKHIVVTLDDGVVFKRLTLNGKEGVVNLKSDNPEYTDFDIPVGQVCEVWKALGHVEFYGEN